MSDDVTYIVDHDAYEQANRIYEYSTTGWRRDVMSLMSTDHCIYHWCMLPLLAVEFLAYLFVAIYPMWCAVPLFVACMAAFNKVNESVSAWAGRRYNRLREKAVGWPRGGGTVSVAKRNNNKEQ